MRWGQQWKQVVAWTRSRRACTVTQRLACASSTSSRVVQCRLASTVFVSGHRAQEVLGRVELGAIGRQEEEVDMVGPPPPQARVPAGPVHHEHDLLARAGAHRRGKGR
jgi:hypothetical protein